MCWVGGSDLENTENIEKMRRAFDLKLVNNSRLIQILYIHTNEKQCGLISKYMILHVRKHMYNIGVSADNIQIIFVVNTFLSIIEHNGY